MKFLSDLWHNVITAFRLDAFKRNMSLPRYALRTTRKFVVFGVLMSFVFKVAGAEIGDAILFGMLFSLVTGFLVLTLGIGWVTKNNGRVEFDELKYLYEDRLGLRG